MQLGIAILIFVGLLWLPVRPLRNRTNDRDHMINLITALVDFHKAQCYFITAIEIAVLVLASQMYGAAENGHTVPIFDLILAIPLALNGIVPVASSLSCIALYSRLSSHIILLSLVPMVSSIAALVSTYNTLFKAPEAFLMGSYEWVPLQHIPGFTDDLCGPRPGISENVVNWGDIRFPIIWSIYAYCLAWTLWCISTQAFKYEKKKSLSAKMLSKFNNSCRRLLEPISMSRLAPYGHVISQLLSRLKNCCRGLLESVSSGKLAVYGHTLLLLLWGLCFAYHFYLYSLFTRSALVSGQWSFGQIIAVTVWIPSIVELLYIEQREWPPYYSSNPWEARISADFWYHRWYREGLEIQISTGSTGRQNSPCDLGQRQRC